jgi:hypothetical protein
MNGGDAVAESTWINKNGKSSDGNSPWQSYAQQNLHAVIQEDHYGRMHFSTQQARPASNVTESQGGSKRPRTGF